MIKKLSNRLDRTGAPLILLPSVLSLADIIATLLGQPASYWRGDLSQALDANPAVVIALNFTPWLALPAAIAWVCLIAGLMLFCPPVWRRRIYLFLCISHFVFVAGWIIRFHFASLIPVLLIGFAVSLLMKKQLARDLLGIEQDPHTYAAGSTAR